jgi:hypothetical protein
MPLVDVYARPGFRLVQRYGRHVGILPPVETRMIIRQGFGRAIPSLLVGNCDKIGLDQGTTATAVQVMKHEFEPDDDNIPDIWVKVQFTEPCPEVWQPIRDAVYQLLCEWFTERGYDVPNFVVDIFWGPGHGRGTVSGEEIEW